MSEYIQRTMNVEHKLKSIKLSECYICKKESADYENLKEINKREKQNIGLLTNSLGRRSLDCKYNHKYIEDKSLKLKSESKYLDKVTGESLLWTVCNCEKVVHPDCLLQSININFNYKCNLCNEIYLLGYKNKYIKFTYHRYAKIIFQAILSILFLVLFLVLITRNTINTENINNNPRQIILYKTLALVFLSLFILTTGFLFMTLIEHPFSKNVEIYLLPGNNKYDMKYGIEKYDTMQSFRYGQDNFNYNKIGQKEFLQI